MKKIVLIMLAMFVFAGCPPAQWEVEEQRKERQHELAMQRQSTQHILTVCEKANDIPECVMKMQRLNTHLNICRNRSYQYRELCMRHLNKIFEHGHNLKWCPEHEMYGCEHIH